MQKGLLKFIKRRAFNFSKKFSFVSSKLNRELEKAKAGLNDEICKANMGQAYIQNLPAKGKTNEEILTSVQSYLKMVVLPYKEGAISGCIFDASDKITELTTRVYEQYCWSNPLHADVFPDVRKMEAEVVRWVLNLYNGDQNSCGTVTYIFSFLRFKCLYERKILTIKMTTGGTESILLACKAYRDLAYEKGIKRPEM